MVPEWIWHIVYISCGVMIGVFVVAVISMARMGE